MFKSSTAIVICTEPGLLEKKSILLAKSLREFGGIYRDIPIFSYSPRGRNISQHTEQIFQQLLVIHLNLELNKHHSQYGLANKIYACAHFETNYDFENIVFLDSDQLILNEPELFHIQDNYDIAVSTVAIKGIGSNGQDKNSSYWENLYGILKIQNVRKIRLASNEKIYPYYNSGLIITKSKNRLFNKWKSNFEQVMQVRLIPSQGSFFIEQSCLSASINQLQLTILELPKSYNYPLLEHPDYQPNLNAINLDQLISLHYHTTFNSAERLLGSSYKALLKGSKWKWIKQQLVELKFLNDLNVLPS